MGKDTISFRLDTKTRYALDALAEATDRDRSFVINEAIADYLDAHRMEEGEIALRIKRAKSGGLASEKEVKAAFEKWKR